MGNRSNYNTLGPQDFFEAIAGPILYADDSPYRLMTRKLNDIDIDYFDGTIPLGKIVDKEIEIDLKHRIVNDFSAYGDELVANKAEGIKEEIVGNVRSLASRYVNRADAICDLNKAFGLLRKLARNQLSFVPTPMYDKAELRELYNAAKQVTLLEKVMGSNDKDVIKYYHALIEHTVWLCRMLMRRRASQFLMQTVDVLSREFCKMESDGTPSGNSSKQPTQELPREIDLLVEQMAEHVHDVWMQTRIEQGWTYAPERNDALKTHPSLVPYDQLPEEEKIYDRNTSINTLRFILSHGFRIEKEQ